MKKVFLACGLFFMDAGCVSTSVDAPMSLSADDSVLWSVSKVTSGEIQYTPIEWLIGDEAVQAARADGIECEEDQACLPNGYYLRYPNGEGHTSTWTLGDTSSITVQLICNTESCTPDNPRENGYKTMNFSKYNTATQSCRDNPLECPYYSIGAGADFFDV